MRGKNSSIETRSSLNALRGIALIIPLVGAFLVTLAGCSDNPVGSGDRVEDPRERPTTFQVEGTFSQQQVNGGKAWVIESVGGETYLPVNLQTENLEEGLRVRAEAEALKSQLVEDRREEIDRELPEEEVIDANPGKLVKINSIEVLGETAQTSTQITWLYPD